MKRSSWLLLLATVLGGGVGIQLARTRPGAEVSADPEPGGEIVSRLESPEATVLERPEVDEGAPGRSTRTAGSPPKEVPTESSHARHLRVEAGLETKATQLGWDKTYGRFSAAELRSVVDDTEQVIFESTKDEFERLFAAGSYEVISAEPTYKSSEFDPTAVYWIRVPPGGPVMKATLPRDQFPEIYEMRALCAWLRRRINRMPP